MRIKYLLIFTFCYIFSSTQIFAQKNKYYKEKYNSTYNSYLKGDLENCVINLEQLIIDDSTYADPYLLLAEIYYNSAKYNDMIPVYQKCVDNCNKTYPKSYLLLANSLLYMGDVENAKYNYEQYLTTKNSKPELKSMAQEQIKKCDFSLDLISKPVPFSPQNLGEEVNSNCDEYYPYLSPEENTLVFTRKVPKFKGADPSSENTQEDFYITYWYGGGWTPAKQIPGNVNTSNNEGAQTISGDGKLMVFAACNRPGGYGQCDLYYSTKIGEKWSVAKNMGKIVNSQGWESQPSLSSDGRTLYFTSERDEGYGQSDIWKTTLDDNNKWTKPVNLGNVINTNDAETSPFIHPDNKTLYYCSNGHWGVGGFDIFFSKINDDGNWSEPKNLGYPINTTKDEIGLIVNTKGNKAYITSSREGGQGLQDLYVFDLYKDAQPESVTYFKAKVFDNTTKKVLKAEFELKDLTTGKSITKSYSDSTDGTFLICLTPGKNYGLFVSSQGYMFYSENINLTAKNSQQKPYEKDIALNKIMKGSKIILNNIFFATDSSNLKNNSQTELNKLISFMNFNSTIKVEISGHTDNKGNAQHNLDLSNRRAKSVYEYLIKNGIKAERLLFKGFGQTLPIATNDNEDGRALNRRTEMKIIE